jgi:hypothetical protein
MNDKPTPSTDARPVPAHLKDVVGELKHKLPPPVPESADAYLARRKLKSGRTLNDYVEDIHLLLANNEQYQAYTWAVYDEQAVEGSLSADNIKAAEMIRNLAREKKIPGPVAKEKLATIAKALNVVMRRSGDSRKQRRYMVGGEYVTDENNGGE